MTAKLRIKNRKITAFGGIFQIEDVFNRLFGPLIELSLGARCNSGMGYSNTDIFRTMASVYLCGGDHIEDVTTHLGRDLKLRPGARVPSSDTIARTLKSLACENIAYESDSGTVYHHNVAECLNKLMIDMLLATGQVKPGEKYTVDFDHEFIHAEKYDALFSYKKKRGYFPGVATIGGMIVGIENRDGNANVKFHQADTLCRIFTRLEDRGIGIGVYRADCGSFGRDIVEMVMAHSDTFYLRASSCQSRREMYEDYQGWRAAEINCQPMEVASFVFADFLPDARLRLVVQRTDTDEGLFGTGHIYRAILTNDWESTEEDIICFYNQRGASERNFDMQNNDFGWAHLPFSFMAENTVFMIVTAMAKNFFLHLTSALHSAGARGVTPVCRVKRFLYAFVAVPAKWIRTGRQWILTLYTDQPYDTYLTG